MANNVYAYARTLALRRATLVLNMQDLSLLLPTQKLSIKNALLLRLLPSQKLILEMPEYNLVTTIT